MEKMDSETDYANEFENLRKRCLELEEKSKKDELRRLILEIEIENLKKKNQEIEGQIANDDENLYEVMAENKVMECEKTKAETEVCFWKEKCKELESNMKCMNQKVKEDVNGILNRSNKVFHSQVKRRLPFEEDGCPNKKIAPSTPGVIQPSFHGIIDISDEDNEIPTVEEVNGSRKCRDLAKGPRSSKNDLQNSNLEHVDEEHADDFKFNSSSTRSAKRKRAAKFIDSDDEDSYDDNAPICTLKTKNISRTMTIPEEEVKQNVSRRHLTRLRKLESENKQDNSIIDLNKTFSSSEDEEDDGVDESESDGESLSGFIVNSSDESERDSDSVSGDSTDESENVLDEFKATLDRIGRKRSSNLKWDLMGDMQSDLGKDPELCMRAVCALYRRQTDDEKECKVTKRARV